VVGRKETADGRPAAILDAGLNALFTALWYDHPVKLASPARGQPRDTVLYGPLCMNIDVVRHSVQLPPLAVGDLLLIAPVGAYNTTQSMQFIEYRPAVVLIHGDREVSLIRAAEDLEIVCAAGTTTGASGASRSGKRRPRRSAAHGGRLRCAP
jgi:diaminopimelate decarboxylase